MLEIENLVVGYGKTEIIHKLSINVQEKELVTLLGANGAGKTTLMKTISGLLVPKAGQINFKNKNIKGMKPEEIVKLRIIHCPQGRRLWPDISVEKNLRLGGYLRKPEMVNKDLEKIYNYFPRVEERKNHLAKNLSGGEQQMVAIGRALMGNPQLLLLDEPTLGLAPTIVDDLKEIIPKIHKNEDIAILMVEQNVNLALQVADRGYILESGYITKEGYREDLEKDEFIKKAYLG